MLPYSEIGDGPALLLLHAGVADRTMWDEHLVPLAEAERRVIAPDLPGFGEAPAPPGPLAHWLEVLRLMDSLSIEEAAIAGNSFGAAVALRIAAVAPERVSSLTLFSVPPVPEPEPSTELSAAWNEEEAALEAGDIDGAVDAVVRAWTKPDATPALRARVAKMQRRNFELQPSVEPVPAPDPLEEEPEILRQITTPTLLAVGALDIVDFRQAAEVMVDALPHGKKVTVEDAGHLIPLEAPDVCRELMLLQ
jgi:3-oxoadipate enol-lactonase